MSERFFHSSEKKRESPGSGDTRPHRAPPHAASSRGVSTTPDVREARRTEPGPRPLPPESITDTHTLNSKHFDRILI